MFDLESNTSRFVLSENLPAEQPRWAPEGNRIVFTSPDVILKTRSLWIAELSPLRLTQVTRDCNDRFPEWDKDGNHILFSRKNNSRTTICQVNVKTQTVTELFYSETVSLDYPQILRD
jgi:Tol biopolymer transport system component